jgi:hypothetical protein
MYYKYDLEGVDLNDCTKLVVLPINAATIPAVLGTLEALAWKARHVSEESWEKGIELYEQLQEVFIVNDCLVDKLDEIVTALGALACICDIAELETQTAQTGLESDIIAALQGNGDVSFRSSPVVDYDQGEVPGEYDSDRCKRAQAIWYNINSAMRQVATINIGGGIVTLGAFVSILAALSVIALPVSIIVGLAIALVGIVYEAALSAQLDTWESLSTSGICCIYQAETMSQARACILALRDANITNVYAKQLISAFFSTTLMGHYHQQSSNIDDFDGDACLECQPLPAGCLPVEACDLADWANRCLRFRSGTNSRGHLLVHKKSNDRAQ